METGGLSQWLNSLGLGEYEDNFISQGYDLDVIVSLGLEAQDFECLGIVKRGHMKKLKYESLKLKQQNGNDIKPNSSFSQNFSELDPTQACYYLELAFEMNNEDMKNLCLSYLEKNARVALSSNSFLLVSPPVLLSILRSNSLDMEEIEVFDALLNWKNYDSNRKVDELLKYIRFGAIEPLDLLQIVEPSEIVPRDFLLPAYRFHSCPQLVDQNHELNFFWKKRKQEVENSDQNNQLYIPPQADFSYMFPIPAKGVKWTCSMSTQYAGLANTYEALVDDKPCYPGAATNYGKDQWIMATFPQPVIVKLVKVSSPSMAEFQSQGWGASYLHNTEIQYSKDGQTWETVGNTGTESGSGFISISLKQQLIGKYWRLYKGNGYLATGSLIFE